MCRDDLREPLYSVKQTNSTAEFPPVRAPDHSSQEPSKVMDADYALVRRLRQRDAAAFEILVKKYKQPLINFATRFLGDPIEARDVAQNVFVRVFKRCDQFQFHSKVSTWLYAIARNLCHNEYRRRLRQRTEPFDSFSSHDLSTGHLLRASYESELEQKIEESLASLPGKQRVAILLFQEQDRSYGEIAVALGISVSATKALIHRGRQELKRQLRPYLQSGAWPVQPQSRTVLELRRSEGFQAKTTGGGRRSSLCSLTMTGI